MKLTTVKIEKPDDINFILGQSHVSVYRVFLLL